MSNGIQHINLTELTVDAKEGARITYVLPGEVKPKTLWKGLGNRAGLHSFQFELLRREWDKSGANFLKKLQALPDGTKIIVHTFRNVNRDRGNWVPVELYIVSPFVGSRCG